MQFLVKPFYHKRVSSQKYKFRGKTNFASRFVLGLAFYRFADLRSKKISRESITRLRYQTGLITTMVLFDLESAGERDIIQISRDACASYRAINNRTKWWKKKRGGEKREKERRFKGKYSQTPREATPN